MACSQEFIDFIHDVISPLGEVRTRKMMGDYVVYLNGKCIATACNDNLYVKIIPQLSGLLNDAETGRPYAGASEQYILDLTDRSLVRQVLDVLWKILPEPKNK